MGSQEAPEIVASPKRNGPSSGTGGAEAALQGCAVGGRHASDVGLRSAIAINFCVRVVPQKKRPQTRNRSSDCPNWGHMGVAQGLPIELAGISAPDHGNADAA
jgi:hypothetical protein